jgi:hypothetical protein
MTGLTQVEEYPMEDQVAKLAKAIQQLQHKVAELELQVVPSTLQEVQDQIEETAWSTVHRIKALALECKQLSSRSSQTYKHLAEDPNIGVTTPGGKETSRNSAGTVEASVSGREDEKVSGTTHGSVEGPCHTK